MAMVDDVRRAGWGGAARVVSVCALLAGLASCGQKGPLYLPDKGGEVVTRPAGQTQQPSPQRQAPPERQLPPQQTPPQQSPQPGSSDDDEKKNQPPPRQ